MVRGKGHVKRRCFFYIDSLYQALAIMAYPTNIPMSITHLAELADDVLFYAGDRSPDVCFLITFFAE